MGQLIQFGGSGAGSSAVTNVTFAQLTNLISTSGLKPGGKYSLAHTTVWNDNKGLVSVGAVETLILTAATTSTLEIIATSVTFPADEVYYTITNVLGVVSASFTGTITKRVTPTLYSDIDFDWRSIAWWRWETAPGSGVYTVITNNGNASKLVLSVQNPNGVVLQGDYTTYGNVVFTSISNTTVFGYTHNISDANINVDNSKIQRSTISGNNITFFAVDLVRASIVGNSSTVVINHSSIMNVIILGNTSVFIDDATLKNGNITGSVTAQITSAYICPFTITSSVNVQVSNSQLINLGIVTCPQLIITNSIATLSTQFLNITSAGMILNSSVNGSLVITFNTVINIVGNAVIALDSILPQGYKITRAEFYRGNHTASAAATIAVTTNVSAITVLPATNILAAPSQITTGYQNIIGGANDHFVATVAGAVGAVNYDFQSVIYCVNYPAIP